MNKQPLPSSCRAIILLPSYFILSKVVLMKDTIIDDSSNSTSKPKNKTARPRPVYLWTAVEVQKWFRRHCSDFYPIYGERFLHHDITGRTLVRVNESTLLRLGVLDPDHRQEIWREIMKLKLKTDILEIRDLERRNNTNYD